MPTLLTKAMPPMSKYSTAPVLVNRTSNYVPAGATAYHHVGGITDDAISTVYLAAIGAGAYHGYKRSKSVGWAAVWALAAAVSPIVTGGVALAQGFGKPKGH
jgi:hypothetical protein